MDVTCNVTQHVSGSDVVPGSSVLLAYVVTVIDSTEPDWNNDVTPIDANTAGGENFDVSVVVVDADFTVGDDPTFYLTASFSLTDGSLSDGINDTHPLELTYTATVSNAPTV